MCANLTEREPQIQFLALEEHKQAQEEQKIEQQKQAEIDKRQSTLPKYCDEAAMYPLKPQKINKEQKQSSKFRQSKLVEYFSKEEAKQIQVQDKKVETPKEQEDLTTKITNSIKKIYPEVEDVNIIEMKNIKNKQNGRPECHFVAEAIVSDFEDELDEEGNYPSKTVLIKGVKSGKYFKSAIIEQDERTL